jgi:hypothetical protein
LKSQGLLEAKAANDESRVKTPARVACRTFLDSRVAERYGEMSSPLRRAMDQVSDTTGSAQAVPGNPIWAKHAEFGCRTRSNMDIFQ